MTTDPIVLAADEELRLQALIYYGDVERFIVEHNLGPVGRGVRQGNGRTGRLTYIKCPFHSERKASFVFFAAHVTKTGQVHCHCFGCQWSGDLFKLREELVG